MPEEGKKSGFIAQIAVAVVIAMCVGGTSPWWFREIFSSQPKPEPAPVTASTPGGGLLTSQNQLQPNSAEASRREKELEEEIARLKQKQSSNPPRRDTDVAISGNWRELGHGWIFAFTQNGSAVSVSVSNGYMLVAGGTGVINQKTIDIMCDTVLETKARMLLTVSDDGTQLNGTLSDPVGTDSLSLIR